MWTATDMAQYQIFVQYQYQYFQKFCFQNQYQYQNLTSNFFNIKININIKISPTSISKSISKFFKTQNQYQNFCGLKICFFTSSDLCHLGPMGYHLIPIAPKHGTLGPSLGTKGPIQRPMLSHLWTSLAQNDYWANSMKPWDPTRNLLHLNYNLGDPK